MSPLIINDPTKFWVDTSRPILDNLKILSQSKPIWPDPKFFVGFFAGQHNIPECTNEGWSRRAWWGYYAARILFAYASDGKGQEIAALVSTMDIAPLEHALAKNKGVILLSNHLGAYPVLYPALKRHAALNVLTITSNPRRTAGDLLHVTTPQQQKLSLTKCMLHLRKNGVLRMAPDGRVVGESTLFFNFMGQQIRFAGGSAELALLSGAQLLWCSATWQSSRSIQINFEPIELQASGESKDAKINAYCLSYLSKLEQQMRLSPQDIGYRGGHILAHKGKLKHFLAPASSAGQPL